MGILKELCTPSSVVPFTRESWAWLFSLHMCRANGRWETKLMGKTTCPWKSVCQLAQDTLPLQFGEALDKLKPKVEQFCTDAAGDVSRLRWLTSMFYDGFIGHLGISINVLKLVSSEWTLLSINMDDLVYPHVRKSPFLLFDSSWTLTLRRWWLQSFWSKILPISVLEAKTQPMHHEGLLMDKHHKKLQFPSHSISFDRICFVLQSPNMFGKESAPPSLKAYCIS